MSLIGVVALGLGALAAGMVNSFIRCSSSGVAPVLSGLTDLDSGFGVTTLLNSSTTTGGWFGPPAPGRPGLAAPRILPLLLLRREDELRRRPDSKCTEDCEPVRDRGLPPAADPTVEADDSCRTTPDMVPPGRLAVGRGLWRGRGRGRAGGDGAITSSVLQLQTIIGYAENILLS